LSSSHQPAAGFSGQISLDTDHADNMSFSYDVLYDSILTKLGKVYNAPSSTRTVNSGPSGARRVTGTRQLTSKRLSDMDNWHTGTVHPSVDAKRRRVTTLVDTTEQVPKNLTCAQAQVRDKENVCGSKHGNVHLSCNEIYT